MRSARWSGGGPEENNACLLSKLSGVPPERRGAAFRCALALCHAGGDALVVSGACRGRIALAPRGTGGFGYDPLFEIAELGYRTFAEASPEEKARLSHRTRAFAKLVPILSLLARQQGEAGSPRTPHRLSPSLQPARVFVPHEHSRKS